MARGTCTRPNTPLPNPLPEGPLPMCGKPATHYLDSSGLLPLELCTKWCAEHVATDDLRLQWIVIP